jgi:mannose-6-phosphate isomerase
VAVKPHVLGPNFLQRFYRGGPRVAGFRGLDAAPEYSPEDWVGSTTAAFGTTHEGVSVIDGRLLVELIAQDPDGYLGPDHAAAFGPNPALLVKLLDAGERLPVHCHPDRDFAQKNLGTRYGKSEAWVVLEAVSEAKIHVGFASEVSLDAVRTLVEDQEAEALLSALNEVPVSAGMTIFVPAGVPHAIGEGILICEVQEPSDLSVLLEWEGFAVDGRAEGHLGLGFDRALECVDCSAWVPNRLESLWATRPGHDGIEVLFPPQADAFFRAQRIRLSGSCDVEPSFALLVVTAGHGMLSTDHGGELELERGNTVLVPFGAGAGRISGEIKVLRCLPPDPAAQGRR